jgi:hypothetical protein
VHVAEVRLVLWLWLDVLCWGVLGCGVCMFVWVGSAMMPRLACRVVLCWYIHT